MPPARSRCDDCGKLFNRKGDLTRHHLLHTGEKPHVCHCGKAFTQRTALRTHENTHTKEKPYKCNVGSCRASFGDPSSCARHRREKHQGCIGFKCPVKGCKSQIKRRSAFRTHLKKHGIDLSAVNIDSMMIGPKEEPSLENSIFHRVALGSVSASSVSSGSAGDISSPEFFETELPMTSESNFDDFPDMLTFNDMLSSSMPLSTNCLRIDTNFTGSPSTELSSLSGVFGSSSPFTFTDFPQPVQPQPESWFSTSPSSSTSSSPLSLSPEPSTYWGDDFPLLSGATTGLSLNDDTFCFDLPLSDLSSAWSQQSGLGLHF